MFADLPVCLSVASLAWTAALSVPHVFHLIQRSHAHQFRLLDNCSDDDENHASGKSPESLVQRVVLAVAAAVGALAALLPLGRDDATDASSRIATILQFATWVGRPIHSPSMTLIKTRRFFFSARNRSSSRARDLKTDTP